MSNRKKKQVQPKAQTLVEFGLSDDMSEWHQQNLADAIGILECLIEREVERMENQGSSVYGNGRLAKRLDLVEEARIRLEQAESM